MTRVRYFTAPDGRVIPIMAGGSEDAPDAAMDSALDDFLAEDDAPDTEETTPAKAEKAKAPAPEKAKAPAPEKAKAPAPEKGPAPWEKDLADRGLDDPAYAEYHRDVVQPYVTQLEQDRADIGKLFGEGDDGRQAATIAANILNALDEDPVQTIVDLASDLEVDTAALAEALGIAPGEPAAEVDEPADEPEVDEDREFLRQLRDERQQAAQTEAYNTLIADLEAEVPGFDKTKFHVAMRAANGDAREAWDYYVTLAGDPAAEAQDDDPVEDPPPVMGAGVGSTPAATTREPKNLDEAIDDFFAEDRAASRKNR